MKTAFLNGKLKQKIHKKVLEGMKNERPQLCRLNKVLYKLTQAVKCWFEEFDKDPTENRFKNSPVFTF